MKREEYNACMRPYITGSKPKEQRKLDFCIGAKMCSGKAKNEEEAKQICLTAPKAPPKPRKRSQKQLAKEREACDLDVFKEIISQFNNVYVGFDSSRCAPCNELNQLIRDADVPYQIVKVPESCVEIQDHLGVKAYPTVLKLSKGKEVSRYEGNPEDTIAAMKKGL